MKYLGLIIFTIAVFYFLGQTIGHLTQTRHEKKHQSFFVKLFSGLIASVVIYSFLKTSFATINTAIILLLIFYWQSTGFKKIRLRVNMGDYKNEFAEDAFTFIKALPFLLGLFFWQYYFILNTESIAPVVIDWDNRFVADLAMFLNESGVETLTWDHTQLSEIGNSPYHYFEAWLVGFVSFIFQENYWLALQMVTIPTLQFILLSGIWAVFEKFKINFYLKLFSVMILFLGGFYFPFLSESHTLFSYTYTWFYGFNAMDEPWFFKITIAYLIFISAILAYFNKKYSLALLILLALPVFSINIAPAILSTVVGVIFLNYLFKYRLLGKAFKLSAIIYPIAVGGYIITFYKVFGGAQIVEIPSATEILYSFVDRGTVSRTEFIIFIEKVMVALILYLPYLVLIGFFVLLIRKKVQKIYNQLEVLRIGITFVVVLIPSALLIWIVLSETYGAHELFFAGALPVIHFLLFLMLYAILINQDILSSLKSLFVTPIILFLLILTARSVVKAKENKTKFEQMYSNEFIGNVKTHAENLNPIGIKVQDIGVFKEREVLYNPFLNLSALYLNHIFDRFALVNISMGEIDIRTVNNAIYKKQLLSSPFRKYVQELREQNKFSSLDAAKLQFVKEHKIKYVIVDVGAELDNVFIPYVKKEIVNDYLAKEKFFLLKEIK